MTLIESIILGIVQGLSEFLPISSSGHLVIASELLNIQNAEGDMLFSICVHLGTLAAVFIAFRSTIWALIKAAFDFLGKLFTGRFKKDKATDAQKILGCLIISLLPLFPVLLVKDYIESLFSSLIFVGIALLITSIFLFFSDRIQTGHVTSKDMTAKKALAVGIVQAIAVVPGISRSGSTITAGLACGLSRKYAAKYSFILSIPTILGAAAVTVIDTIKSDFVFTSDMLLIYIVGFLVSGIVGYMAIMLLEYILKSRKFIIFSVYTFIVGTIAVIFGIIRL